MSAALIEARGVTKILGGIVPVTLVQDISLAILPREFIAITGPSGSGKSSLLYLLGLLDLPTTGEVLIDGQSTTVMTEDERAEVRLTRLGFVFQFHFLLPEFSITENVALPMRALGRLPPRAIVARAEELLESFGLGDHGTKPRINCPAASGSAWRWRGRWPTIPRSFSRTNRPEASIPFPPRRCSASCAIWWRCAARPWSPSPMISIWHRKCIAGFTSSTAGWRTTKQSPRRHDPADVVPSLLEHRRVRPLMRLCALDRLVVIRRNRALDVDLLAFDQAPCLVELFRGRTFSRGRCRPRLLVSV